MRRGPWKVSEETQERLANSCPLQSKLCYFGAELLPTAVFPRRGLRACAKRCAADSRCKNRSASTRPPSSQPPHHTTINQVDACPLATGPCRMFGDNNSVVINTTLPSSMLKKKHQAIAYHAVRMAQAAGILTFEHIKSEDNWADVLTKPLSPMKFLALVRPLIFRRSGTK